MLIVQITYNRLEYTINSVRSVIKDLSKSTRNHKLVVVDNGSQYGLDSCLKLMHSHCKFPFELVLYNFNVGKAKAVNNVVAKYGEVQSILCSFDGDLVVDEHGCFFDKMEETFIGLHKYGNYDILCANLTGNNAHNLRLLRGIHYTPFGKILYNPKGGSGVAGGCLVMDTAIFTSLGGYRTNQGIYGGNDGFLIVDVMKRNPNALVGMVESLSVFHPFEHDEGYERYKREAIDKIRKTGFGETKGFYDNESYYGYS